MGLCILYLEKACEKVFAHTTCRFGRYMLTVMYGEECVGLGWVGLCCVVLCCVVLALWQM